MADLVPILPGSVIGVLGSGQLGRMLALAARSLGYRVHVYSPDPDSPAGPVCDQEFIGAYEDLDSVRAFARGVDVVTFEFENVPSITSLAAAEVTRVRPDGGVLHVTQQRLREKAFLAERGFPVTPFRAIRSLVDLREAVGELGLPGVLKTASFGYDGKGQQKLVPGTDLEAAHAGLRGAEGIYEAYVDFVKEVSVVAARTLDGSFQAFPVFENVHANHILDVTFAPAALSPTQARQAEQLARGILGALGVVGLLTVELFVTRDGRLLVNELAPRTHNSGHLTIDACLTSQFEQQIRAICGLPLGNTALQAPAAMANLLGDVWLDAGGSPDWPTAMRDPGLRLHLYGKTDPRRGRKMGHLTALDNDVTVAVERVRTGRDLLSRRPISQG